MVPGHSGEKVTPRTSCVKPGLLKITFCLLEVVLGCWTPKSTLLPEIVTCAYTAAPLSSMELLVLLRALLTDSCVCCVPTDCGLKVTATWQELPLPRAAGQLCAAENCSGLATLMELSVALVAPVLRSCTG